MIIINIQNGLGNQMFQYAFGMFLKKRCPEAVIKYDVSELGNYIAGRKIWDINDVFQTDFEMATLGELKRYGGKFIQIRDANNRLTKKINRHIWKISGVKYVDEPPYYLVDDTTYENMKNINIDSNRNYYFRGFWENPKYLDDIKESVLNTFSFRHIEGIGDELIALVETKTTCSIHLRRGDYLKASNQGRPTDYYYVCTEEYYRRAMEMVAKEVDNVTFVFFSDDPDYVDSTFEDITDKIVVRNQKDYEDMYLMMRCKHHIIANSTFSFWAAYLNDQNGITISPNVHYVRLEENREMTIPFFHINGWRYIDVSEMIDLSKQMR